MGRRRGNELAKLRLFNVTTSQVHHFSTLQLCSTEFETKLLFCDVHDDDEVVKLSSCFECLLHLSLLAVALTLTGMFVSKNSLGPAWTDSSGWLLLLCIILAGLSFTERHRLLS